MTERRLSDSLWRTVQESVPIFCVDVLPVRRDATGSIQLGLIRRQTPAGGDRWCFIGGRLLLDETIDEAVERELSSALAATLRRDGDPELGRLVIEYQRRPRTGFPQDPRQHAVSVTVLLWMTGEGISRGGEAKEFSWWHINDLDGSVMGFGQEVVLPRIHALLASEPDWRR